MESLTENLAMVLAFDEARKQPRHMWPDPGFCTTFAGRDLMQQDLADLVFEKYRNHFIAEAESILKNRASQPPFSSLIIDDLT
jgi:hypothetical protein